MIKVMIVDDEEIVREGIKFIIDNNFKDEIKIVALAKTGREAIEFHELYRPDIILMDIQMPGINGIEAIEEIQAIDKLVRFVIISAYEQFEYAKSAVELGVNEYILKPINKQKLSQVLRQIMKSIYKSKEAKRRELEIQEKLDKVLPVLEFGYIYSIIMNRDYQKENIDYHSLLNIKKDYAYIMLLDFGEGNEAGVLENKIGSGVKGNLKYQSISHAIKYKVKAIVGPLMVNRLVVLIYEDMPEDEYLQRVKAVELAESIHESLVKLCDSKVYIGIGSSYKSHRLNISYTEAAKAISRMTGEEVLHIKDATGSIEVEKAYNFRKIKNDQDYISLKVEEGNSKEVNEALLSFFSKLERDYFDNIDLVRNIILELMVLVYTSGYRNGVFNQGDSTISYVDEIKKMTTLLEIKNWVIEKTTSITDEIKGQKEHKVSAVIAEAMAYMEENYSQDLRLNEVAKVVAISPQYFSKIFKEELGVNFIDYLTKLRMEEAKKMLKKGEQSIKEICYHIGYNDPNYFSRLFKRIEGISPTEFS